MRDNITALNAGKIAIDLVRAVFDESDSSAAFLFHRWKVMAPGDIPYTVVIAEGHEATKVLTAWLEDGERRGWATETMHQQAGLRVGMRADVNGKTYGLCVAICKDANEQQEAVMQAFPEVILSPREVRLYARMLSELADGYDKACALSPNLTL